MKPRDHIGYTDIFYGVWLTRSYLLQWSQVSPYLQNFIMKCQAILLRKRQKIFTLILFCRTLYAQFQEIGKLYTILVYARWPDCMKYWILMLLMSSSSLDFSFSPSLRSKLIYNRSRSCDCDCELTRYRPYFLRQYLYPLTRGMICATRLASRNDLEMTLILLYWIYNECHFKVYSIRIQSSTEAHLFGRFSTLLLLHCCCICRQSVFIRDLVI